MKKQQEKVWTSYWKRIEETNEVSQENKIV